MGDNPSDETVCTILEKVSGWRKLPSVQLAWKEFVKNSLEEPPSSISDTVTLKSGLGANIR